MGIDVDHSDTKGKLELVRKITEYAGRLRKVADRHTSLATFYGRMSDQLASSAVFVTDLTERHPDSELAQFLIGQFSMGEPLLFTATERAEFAISEVEEDTLRDLAPATSTSSILSLTVPPLIVESSPEDVRAEWESFLATYDIELELSTVRKLLAAGCTTPPLSSDLLDDFDDAIRDYKTKPADRKYAGLIHLRTVVFMRFVESIADHHGISHLNGSKWVRKIIAAIMGEERNVPPEIVMAAKQVESVWNTFSDLKDGKAPAHEIEAAFLSFVSAFSLMLALRATHYSPK